MASERIALREEYVWRVEFDLVLRQLPCAQPWCAGWSLVQDHAVPVLGWDESPQEGRAGALVVVASQDHLLGLPCSAVRLVNGTCRGQVNSEGRYPSHGQLVTEDGGQAVAVDLPRLFLALGIVDRSGYTTLEG